MVDLSHKFTQQEFADVVGIQQSRVSHLFSRGVLVKGVTLGEAVHAYCAHLREVAAGRKGESGLDLPSERAALAKAQRERVELQNQVTRGELVPLVLLEQVLAKTASKVAAILDKIPGNIRRRWGSIDADQLAVIEEACAQARNTAAEMSLELLHEDSEAA